MALGPTTARTSVRLLGLSLTLFLATAAITLSGCMVENDESGDAPSTETASSSWSSPGGPSRISEPVSAQVVVLDRWVWLNKTSGGKGDAYGDFGGHCGMVDWNPDSKNLVVHDYTEQTDPAPWNSTGALVSVYHQPSNSTPFIQGGNGDIVAHYNAKDDALRFRPFSAAGSSRSLISPHPTMFPRLTGRASNLAIQ